MGHFLLRTLQYLGATLLEYYLYLLCIPRLRYFRLYSNGGGLIATYMQYGQCNTVIVDKIVTNYHSIFIYFIALAQITICKNAFQFFAEMYLECNRSQK